MTFVLVLRDTAVRVLFAVPLCFALPGYGLAMATFGKRPPRALDTFLLTPTLSIATLVIGAVLLDLMPGGIRIGSWAVLLMLVVVVACALAVMRRADATLPARQIQLPRASASQSTLLVAALVAACGALVLSRVPLSAVNAIGYSQLWMNSVGTPVAPAVHIGVRSAEAHTTTYRLVLISGSGRPRAVDTRLTLRPGGHAAETVRLLNLPGLQAIVTAELYKLGSPHVYRYVTAVVTSLAHRVAVPRAVKHLRARSTTPGAKKGR
jgi:hypothetical protein